MGPYSFLNLAVGRLRRCRPLRPGWRPGRRWLWWLRRRQPRRVSPLLPSGAAPVVVLLLCCACTCCHTALRIAISLLSALQHCFSMCMQCTVNVISCSAAVCRYGGYDRGGYGGYDSVSSFCSRCCIHCMCRPLMLDSTMQAVALRRLAQLRLQCAATDVLPTCVSVCPPYPTAVLWRPGWLRTGWLWPGRLRPGKLRSAAWKFVFALLLLCGGAVKWALRHHAHCLCGVACHSLPPAACLSFILLRCR